MNGVEYELDLFDDRLENIAFVKQYVQLLESEEPRPDEVFGDNAFIVANLELEPETSDNLNAGFTIDSRDERSGEWRAGVNAFLREAEELIVLLGSDRVQSYQNVFGARSVGTEAALGWTSPGELFIWDLNFTYLDFRNTSSSGTFGDFA